MLKKADIFKLEAIFGNSKTFSSKLSFLGSRIAENASANVSNISSQYTLSGSLFYGSTSRYDFFG